MENSDTSHFDAAKYKELNNYFRLKIKELLDTNPTLQQLAQDNKMQLEDIVNCMHLEDQVRWSEYMKLDQLKMQQDIQDHLEGKGTPFQPTSSLSKLNKDATEEDHLW